ncbi:MAG: toprim domain-containing protein, partial [Candidatus Omnitrophica bacterium]|nr:toprim domain-containing protein [Candidatus Omnitrophota bacterium]
AASGTRDIFRRRLLFPIFDLRGEVVGFGGRAVDDHQEPKYLNTGETPVFNKSRVLYGLNWAREGIRDNGYALLVEGYFDVLRLHQHGFRNAVAPLGTALTDNHLSLLRRFTDKLLLLFDADESGIMAVWKSLESVLRNGFQVKVGALPGGFDPDKFLDDYGEESFRHFINQSQDFLDFGLQVLSRMQDSQSPRGKAIITKEMTTLISAIPDKIEQHEYLSRLAGRLHLPLVLLEKTVYSRKGGEEKDNYSGQGLILKKKNVELAETELLRVLLADDSYWKRLYVFRGKLTDRMEYLIGVVGRLESQNIPVDASALMGRIEDERLQEWLAGVAMDSRELEEGKKEKIFVDCVRRLVQWRLSEQAKQTLSGIKDKKPQEINQEDIRKLQDALTNMKKG